jgi:hypothetical protein
MIFLDTVATIPELAVLTQKLARKRPGIFGNFAFPGTLATVSIFLIIHLCFPKSKSQEPDWMRWRWYEAKSGSMSVFRGLVRRPTTRICRRRFKTTCFQPCISRRDGVERTKSS